MFRIRSLEMRRDAQRDTQEKKKGVEKEKKREKCVKKDSNLVFSSLVHETLYFLFDPLTQNDIFLFSDLFVTQKCFFCTSRNSRKNEGTQSP